MLKSIKEFFNRPEPKLGDTRLNPILLVLPLTLEGERRWWGWHMVEEEAVEAMDCIEGICSPVIKFVPKRWVD